MLYIKQGLLGNFCLFLLHNVELIYKSTNKEFSVLQQNDIKVIHFVLF